MLSNITTLTLTVAQKITWLWKKNDVYLVAANTSVKNRTGVLILILNVF